MGKKGKIPPTEKSITKGEERGILPKKSKKTFIIEKRGTPPGKLHTKKRIPLKGGDFPENYRMGGKKGELGENLCN